VNRQRQEQVIWQEQRDSTRQLRATLLLGVIAFSVTLAIILGNKVNQTTASVIIGVAAGVAASIPTSFILLILLRNRQRSTLEQASLLRYPPVQRAQAITTVQQAGISRGGWAMPQPPVIVVTPSGNYGSHAQYQQGPVYPDQMPVLIPAPREFQVIGEPGYSVDQGY
jgi:hypothetical protein